MEEKTVELYDYLTVIWKRRILIIVVTLVCIGVGVANTKLKLKLQTYHAKAVIKIGKKVKLMPTSGISPIVDYIEDPKDLKEIIPHKYAYLVDDSGYSLKIKTAGSLSVLNLIMEGTDNGVERVLKKVVDTLIDEHTSKAQDSVLVYRNFMTKLEKDVDKIQREIAATEISIMEMKASIRKVKGAEGDYLLDMPPSTGEENAEDSFLRGGGQSAFLNLLYLKTIEKERVLSNSRVNLRKTQWDHYQNKITLGNLEEYKTELVGKIVTSSIKQNSRRDNMKIAAVAGFIISLFITFFWEYIVESKSRRKGKLQG